MTTDTLSSRVDMATTIGGGFLDSLDTFVDTNTSSGISQRAFLNTGSAIVFEGVELLVIYNETGEISWRDVAGGAGAVVGGTVGQFIGSKLPGPLAIIGAGVLGAVISHDLEVWIETGDFNQTWIGQGATWTGDAALWVQQQISAGVNVTLDTISAAIEAGVGWTQAMLHDAHLWIERQLNVFQQEFTESAQEFLFILASAGSVLDSFADLEVGAFLADIFSPLVIDLNGNGVELTALAGSAAFFDLDIDGFAQNTGWVSPNDALLALDVDGNGIIDDGSELFGDQTGYANGFLALAAHDSNGDGVIDASDAVFSDLIVWQDTNGDGFSAASEMMSLTDVGITSIDLGYTDINETNQGHSVLQRSSVTFSDGRIHNIDDVYFENDPRASIYLLPDNFQYHEDAFKLPALFGYGHIASTWVVLSQDVALRQDATNLVTQLSHGDVSGFLANFEDFMLAWAGVDQVNPTSRGDHIDARHLAFLEKAYGQEYDQSQGTNPTPLRDPEHLAADALTIQFNDLMLKLAGRFMAQSAVSSGLQGATDQTLFDAILATHPLASFGDLAANYSPSARSLKGDQTAVFEAVTTSVQTGQLTLQNAALSLLTIQKDVEPNLAAYKTAFQSFATLNGSAAAQELEAVISAYDGQTLVAGGVLNDNLAALHGTVFFGGAGDDVIANSNKSDLFVYKSGDGSDTIVRNEHQSGDDKLLFVDLNAADVTFASNLSGDLLINMPDGSVMTIVQHFSNWRATVEQIEFADGTVFFEADIIHKSAEDQKATGYIVGAYGADTYLHTSGDGSYSIYDVSSIGTTIDRFVFTDQNVQDVTFSTNTNNDLVMTLTNGEVVTIIGHFFNGGNYDVELIEFANGTVFGLQDVRDKHVADQKASGHIVGTINAENYYHALGDGSYTILDDSSLGRQVDRLYLTDQLVGDVSFSTNANQDLVMTMSDGEVVRVIGHFQIGGDYDIEQIAFADGALLGLQAIRDKSVADQKASGTVIGTINAETYVHSLGDGSYTILDESSLGRQVDRLYLTDQLQSNVTFGRRGDDLTLILSNGENLTVREYFNFTNSFVIEQFIFSDGSVLTRSDMNGTPYLGDDTDNVIYTGDGNEAIYGFAGNDTIHAGDGNDLSDGGDGDDYIYGTFGDDTFIGGEGFDTLDFSYSSDNFNIDLSTNQAVFSTGFIEQISGFEALIGGAGNNGLTGDGTDNYLSGAAGNDTINAGAGNDTIDGGVGNDVLYGEAGNDTILTGEGDDFADGGAGDDWIHGSFGNDSFAGGAGFDTLDFSYSTVDFDINLTTGTAIFFDGFTEYLSGFEAVIGGIGVNTLIGDDGDNILDGGGGNDRIEGLLGSDLLTGGSGNDVFVFAADALGVDTVTDFTDGQDALDISAWNVSGFADLTITSAEQETASGVYDVTVTSGTNALVLSSLSLTQANNVAADDFIFV